MSRKSKNIIAVIIMFVLIISIILTICLGKEKRSNNYGNFPVQENRPTIKERELPRRKYRNEVKDSETEEKEDKEDSVRETSLNLASNSMLDQGKCGGNSKCITMGDLPQRQERTNDCNVILLCIETFLLGGTIMFLIMNNVDQKETIKYVEVVKEEKKDKKQK